MTKKTKGSTTFVQLDKSPNDDQKWEILRQENFRIDETETEFGNTLLHLVRMTWPNKLECSKILAQKGVIVMKTLAYWAHFVSYKENEAH